MADERAFTAWVITMLVPDGTSTFISSDVWPATAARIAAERMGWDDDKTGKQYELRLDVIASEDGGGVVGKFHIFKVMCHPIV